MKTNEYRKSIMPKLSVKEAKAGIRQMIRKKNVMNLGHALVGIDSEIGETMIELSPYLLGHQLNDHIRAAARPEFGDIGFYLVVACKQLKIKLPSSTKKLKLHGKTTSEALFDLQRLGTKLISAYKKVYYGQELNQQKVSDLLNELIPLYWQLCYTLFGVTPSEVFAENAAKLDARYKTGVFSTEAIAAKDAADAEAEKQAA